MKFDYWHIRRSFRLVDMREGDILPFGKPPYVIGEVVTCPEPLWRTVVSTANSLGASDSLTQWTWKKPLPPQEAQIVSQFLENLINHLKEGESLQYPEDQDDDDLLDKSTVMTFIQSLGDLLTLAAQRSSITETWSE
ncbi:hypothetical protein [Streptomyces sp. NPDC092952]|uniref:hypothetical protein n=1 Tax=Streptomyces sp. NPDC092952 TaxID=3366018 RepID=UPI00380398E0